jgi:tetratricopeptide (TPR) repeat protein
LTFEAERLEKRLDQQTRAESKKRLVEQINIYLHSSDYSRALDLLRGTAAEFPEDLELSELEKLAQDRSRRKAEADRLITESQELFAQQKSAKAIQLLREAYELDRNNSLARSILANALVEHAYSIVETNWWEAETLANEALALNPSHPTARSIHNRILDQKTSGSVEEWVAQTRKLQSCGNLSAALSQIAEGFTVYPRNPRLLQIQDAIRRDYDAQRRQARRRDLEDLRRMESEIDTVADLASKKALESRIQAAIAKYSTDGEFLSVSNGLLHRLGLIEVPEKSSALAQSNDTGVADQPPPPGAPDSSQSAPSKVSSGLRENHPVDTTPVLPNEILPSPLPSGEIPPGEASPSPVQSEKAPPSDASSKLPHGIVPQVKLPVTPAEPLVAEAPAVNVSGADASAPAAKIASPSTQPKKSARSNSATLVVISAAAIIAIAATLFFVRKYHAPSIAKTPAAVPSVSAPGVADSTVPSPAVTAPAAPPASIPEAATSAAVPAVVAPAVSAPAPTISEPSQPGRFVEAGHNVESGHNVGALLVVAGQDNASVFLNGKLQPQLTQAGQLRLPNLELRDYVVQVSKSGFQNPPQQTIRIRKGEQAKLVFNLLPQPHLASLIIQGGAPGTGVVVDQVVAGTIQPDGTFSASTINPGDHTVELRKERFKARQLKKHFVAGEAITLTAADATLDPAPGELKITFTPADAKVAIVKPGGLPTIVSSGVPLSLSAGTYTLTARTADRFARSSTFEVIAGQSKTLDLLLAPNGMSRWDDPADWKNDKDSFIHKGGDFVTYGIVPVSGTFSFSAMPAKGRLLQWVLNYTDSKNYVLFQIDDNNFYRALIRNGQKTNEIIVPDKGDKKSFRTLHVRVSPTEIVHQIKHGDSWTVLDRWTQPGTDLSVGKFAFYIPGNDEVDLSSFEYYADLNIR